MTTSVRIRYAYIRLKRKLRFYFTLWFLALLSGVSLIIDSIFINPTVVPLKLWSVVLVVLIAVKLAYDSAARMRKEYYDFKKNEEALERGQSAMEYLMTYGWAILIIAVVLGALFSLGVFSGTGILGTACIARSSYLCQNPVYTHTGANIIVTVGQSTGNNWASANFMFVPQGQASAAGLPVTLTSAGFTALGNTLYLTGFTSGQSASITLPVNGVSGTTINVGTPATGTIWVQYTIIYSGTGIPTPFQYAQIATINVRAS
jgi:hypothetical protein